MTSHIDIDKIINEKMKKYIENKYKDRLCLTDECKNKGKYSCYFCSTYGLKCDECTLGDLCHSCENTFKELERKEIIKNKIPKSCCGKRPNIDYDPYFECCCDEGEY